MVSEIETIILDIFHLPMEQIIEKDFTKYWVGDRHFGSVSRLSSHGG
jgi:hypothetical protein